MRAVLERRGLIAGAALAAAATGFFSDGAEAGVFDALPPGKGEAMPLALLLGFVGLLFLQWFTSFLALWRLKHRVARLSTSLPPVSLIRPCCGVDAYDEATLASSFRLDYPEYEILFCVASERDPAAALVRRLIALHPERPARLLVGDSTLTTNPKVNNLVKAVPRAKYEILCMTDANLLLPRDYLLRLVERFDAETGMVSSPAAGGSPENFWGSVEAAMLNSHQARWQYIPDITGQGFAQGKTLCFRRSVLLKGGGMKALGTEMAEDVASTKLVRRQGLRVRLPQAPFFQPIGRKTFGQVWGRQLRWARIRRDGFPLIYLPEILPGIVPALAALIPLTVMGVVPVWFAAALLVLWYAPEVVLCRAMGWPCTPRDVLAMFVRDLLMPVLWICGWFGRKIVWRGNVIETRESISAAEAAKRRAGRGLENA